MDCEKECKDMNIDHSPEVLFERTVLNMKIVDNPEFPSVGECSLMSLVWNKGHFFAKAVS